MRCTQLIGLRKEAEDFLMERAKRAPREVCPTCGHVKGGNISSRIYDAVTGRKAGMFDDGPDLQEYDMEDGSVLQEVVQDAPWASGPCIFLCLRNKSTGGTLFVWSEQEIEDNL